MPIALSMPHGSQSTDLASTELSKELATFTGHREVVTAVVVSSDGKTAYSSSGKPEGPGEIRSWDVSTGHEIRAWAPTNFGILALSLAPDGQVLAGSGSDGSVYLWNTSTGMLQATLKRHEGKVFSVVFSADGKRLATAGEDRSIRLWDTKAGEVRDVLNGHKDIISSLAFAADGSVLASGSFDGTARIWDLAMKRERATLIQPTGRVYALAITSDGQTLAVGTDKEAGQPGLVYLWDVAKAELRQKLVGPRTVCALAYSPSGKLLASAHDDGSMRLWHAGEGVELVRWQAHAGWITSLAFNADSQRLLTSSWDRVARVWDAPSWPLDQRLGMQDRAIATLAFAPGQSKLTFGGSEKLIKIVDLTTGKVDLVLRGHGESIRALAYNHQGSLLASCSGDVGNPDKPGEVKIWNPTTGKEQVSLKGHSTWVDAVTFSPDGKRLATGGHDKAIKIWDVGTGQEKSTLTGHTGAVRALAFTPQGHELISGSLDGTVRVWNLESAKEESSWDAHIHGVNALALSPDGALLATVARPNPQNTAEGEVKVWRMATAELAYEKRIPGQAAQSVAFSPNGQLLAACGLDCVHVWIAASGQPKISLHGHKPWLQTIAFRSDGKMLASGGGYQDSQAELRLWSDDDIILW